MKVWVAMIEHGYGHNGPYVTTSYDLALQEVADYCRQEWGDTDLPIEDEDGNSLIPEDNEECVGQYFEYWREHDCQESYTIEETELIEKY